MQQMEKKRSWKDIASGMIFADDGVPNSPTNTATTETQQSVAPVRQTAPTYVAAAPIQGGGVNADGVSKFRSMLLDTLQEKALTYFDYLKFKHTLDILKTSLPDEGTRFKAAFASAISMKVSKAKLLESTTHYLTVLTEEQNEFQAATNAQNDSKIVAAENEIVSLEQKIVEKNEQIQALAAEVVELTNTKNSLTSRLAEEKITIAQYNNSFAAALSSVTEEIKSDAQKITTYISETN